MFLVEVLLKVVFTSDKLYKHDYKYQELLKAILSHTNFEPLIRIDSSNLVSILKFYNNIRNCNFCNDNPFYWEQFASICIEARDYLTAKQCIDNAYSCAKKITGFTPFQISTIHGELLLKELLFNLTMQEIEPDTCIDIIVETHKLFTQYYFHPENNHYYIFSCVQNYLIVYEKIEKRLSRRHFSILIEKLTDIYDKLIKYQDSMESQFYPSTIKWSTNIAQCLNNAKNKLKLLN